MFHNFYHIILLAAGIYLVLLLFTWLLYKHFTKKLKKQEREKMYSILAAQENERQEIAREVHDNLGALLSITNMQIETLMETCVISQQKKDLKVLHQQLKEAIIICRNISHDLTPYLDKSDLLEEILRDYVVRVNQSKKLKVEFTYSASAYNMDNPVSVSLCRILFEMTTNTIRHAGATAIKVSIFNSGENLVTDYADNGVGFHESGSSAGIGLKNIASRVHMLKGDIHYFPKSDLHGMHAVITIPVNEVL